jgi:hypothetical protein
MAAGDCSRGDSNHQRGTGQCVHRSGGVDRYQVALSVTPSAGRCLVSWTRSVVTATRGFAAREPLVATLLGLLVAVFLLVSACRTSGPAVGNGGGPSVGSGGHGEEAIAVAPVGSIVPLTGGRDIPDAASFPAPARMLLQEADRGLRAGDFDAVAREAQRVREGAGKEDTKTRCVADAVEGIANVNRRDPKAGLQELQQGECAIRSVPDDVRSEMATLYHRARGYAYAQIGSQAAAKNEFDLASKLSPGEKGLIANEFCSATARRGAGCAATRTTTKPPPTRTTTKPPPTRTTTKPPPTTTTTKPPPTTTTKPVPSKPTPSKPIPSKPRPTKARGGASTTPTG